MTLLLWEIPAQQVVKEVAGMQGGQAACWRVRFHGVAYRMAQRSSSLIRPGSPPDASETVCDLQSKDLKTSFLQRDSQP